MQTTGCGLYYLIANSTDFLSSFSEVGPNNVSIAAWKYGFFAHQKTFIWNILETPTNLSANISTHSGYGGSPFKVRLYFNNTYHNYLSILFYSLFEINIIQQ